MSTKETGGPAFPEIFTDGPNERRDHADIYSAGGMTLRDYFAAHAPAPKDWFIPIRHPRPKDNWSASNSTWRFDSYSAAAKWCRDNLGHEPENLSLDAQAKWDFGVEIDRDTQWPYAWADYMIAERNKP